MSLRGRRSARINRTKQLLRPAKSASLDMGTCGTGDMFAISICEPRQIVLIRFFGELNEDDFRRLDDLAAKARAGNASFDSIFDMTGVEHVDIAAQFVAARGALPQAYRDRRRLYVVSQDDLKLLVKLYATYQANEGSRALEIVPTLEEAFATLEVSASEFRPWPLS
jgi:hypothetical protein